MVGQAIHSWIHAFLLDFMVSMLWLGCGWTGHPLVDSLIFLRIHGFYAVAWTLYGWTGHPVADSRIFLDSIISHHVLKRSNVSVYSLRTIASSFWVDV